MVVNASAQNQLPCGRMLEGVSNLQGNCILKRIGDSKTSDGVSISHQGGNRGEEQRLKSAANLMEESVTDEKRSLNVAGCQLRKLPKLLNHVKATTRVSAELHNLDL